MLLYKFNNPEDEVALLAWADSQWTQKQLWIEGGNATSGEVVSNKNLTNFATVSVPCATTFNYFYCEYNGEKNFSINSF